MSTIKYEKGKIYKAIVRCKRSPASNPYVVLDTQLVKQCPRQSEKPEWKVGVPLEECAGKPCKSLQRLEGDEVL